MRVYASAEMTLTDTNDGISVTGIDRHYMASSSSSGITVSSQGWQPDPQETNPISRYHWSYEVVNYSSGPPVPTKPAIIGVYGKDGKEGVDAVTVSLSSEAHTFAGTESNAIASSITIDVSAFKGNQRISTSIGTVTGGITGELTHSESGRGTTSNKLVINVTSSLNKGNGTLSIPIVADGRTFNKVFSWSVAFKGKTGDKGDTGSILGENQWIGHKYSYPGSTRIYPSFDHIQGLNPIATEILDDSTRFTFNDDYYIAHFQTNLYVSLDKQITTTVSHDDNLTIYCDGEVVVSKNATASTPYNITFNLKAGWNKIDVLLHEMAGGDHVSFGTKLSSLVEHLSYIKGSDGVSIVKVDVEYYLSTSATSLAGGSWSTTAPAWKDGLFMWSRTVTTYTSGLPTESKPVCITGAKGSTGGTGATGRGVSSIVEQFYLSDSKVAQTGGSWSTTMPTWLPGKYVWTQSLITYTSGTPATSTTEPLVSSEWEAINELEIGGRNLLKGTSDEWTQLVMREGVYLMDYGTDLKLEEGETYTFSLIVEKVSNDSVPINLHLGLGHNPYTYTYDISSWRRNNIPFGQKITLTQTVTAGDTNNEARPYFAWRLRNERLATTIRFKEAKLEKGNIATDWTPAPEDVQSQIDKSVKSTDVEYYLSTSSTGLSGGKWQTTAPPWDDGKYMWSRTKIVLNDGTPDYKPSATGTNISGAKGSTGGIGAPGRGVSSIVEQFYLSDSKTVEPPTSGWLTSPPTWSPGKYIWTRSLITYTTGTPITSTTKPLVSSEWEAINEIQIGGRNLYPNTTNQWRQGTFAGWQLYLHDIPIGEDENLKAGDRITWSGIINPAKEPAGIMAHFTTNTGGYIQFQSNFISGGGVGKAIGHTVVPNNVVALKLAIRHEAGDVPSDTVRYKELKIEKGNVATDWSPAPEDVQSQIDDKTESGDFNQLVETVTIESERLNSINTDVESTKNNFLITHTDEYVNKITTTESTVEGLESRVVSVEETKENVDTFFQFDDAFTIGKSNAQTKLRMTNDEIQFLDGETKGTYITGNTMVSQNMQIQDKLNLPKHTFETEGDITVVKYIG